MVTILFTILHVLVSLFLILVVLAQQGKGQDLASAFGGGGSQTAFGARGTATLLSKITAGAAITFMVTSLTLSYLRPAVSNDTVIPEGAAPAAAPGTTDPEAPPPEPSGEAGAADTESAEEGAAPAPSGESESAGEGEGAGAADPPPKQEQEPEPPA